MEVFFDAIPCDLLGDYTGICPLGLSTFEGDGDRVDFQMRLSGDGKIGYTANLPP